MSSRASDPTPEQIREECKKIQNQWSKNQEFSRLVYHPPEHRIPNILVSDIFDYDELPYEFYNQSWRNDA